MKDALNALAAISNIINKETDKLKSKAIQEDSFIESIKADNIESNIMIEVNKRFDLLESKLSAVQPQPVVDLTKVFAALEAIEERLKKLETVPTPSPVLVSALSPTENNITVQSKLEVVHVDPDIATKVKSISESLNNAINKIEEKVNNIEATIAPASSPVSEEEEAALEEEAAVEETAVEEAAVEEEATEEEEEEELTEFRYKGKDYYMDAECNVYEADEEGNPILVGVYNEVTRKITFNN